MTRRVKSSIAFFITAIVLLVIGYIISGGGLSIPTLGLNSTRLLGTTVLPSSKLSSMIKGKEDITAPSISLDSISIPYDESSNTIFIPQSISNTDWTGLLSSSDGNLYLESDSLVIDGSLDKLSLISEGHNFHIYQISANNYHIYNAVFTGMPVIRIDEDSLSIYDPDHSDSRLENIKCTTEIHGSSSIHFDKPSYNLKLAKDKLSLAGLRVDDDWILNSLYNDDGLIHERLSYDLWHEFAESNNTANDTSVSMRFVELFKDSEYQGVYGLLERIDSKSLGLSKKDKLYKCKSPSHEGPGDDDFYSVLTDSMYPNFVIKYPKEKEYELSDWAPLKAWTDTFCSDEAPILKVDNVDSPLLINPSADSSSPSVYLNLDSATDYALFIMLICGLDNTMKNTYYVARYQDDNTYIIDEIPYDLDMTWGDSWIDNDDLMSTIYMPENATNPDAWTRDMKALYENNPDVIYDLLASRYSDLRQKIITPDHILSLVSSYYDYLYSTGAYNRNFTKWPVRTTVWDDEYIYDYINNRIEYLDQYFGYVS